MRGHFDVEDGEMENNSRLWDTYRAVPCNLGTMKSEIHEREVLPRATNRTKSGQELINSTKEYHSPTKELFSNFS
jgi:hypothetical protein